MQKYKNLNRKKVGKILFFPFIAMLGFNAMAQDVILKEDGSEIEAKVIEITDLQIKYKDFDYQDGPTRNVNISEVFMITYENGERKVFNRQTSTQTTSEKVYTSSTEPKKNIDSDFRITTKTMVALTIPGDHDYKNYQINFRNRIGNKLYSFGVNVVPYETAKRNAIITNQKGITYQPISIEISVHIAKSSSGYLAYTFSFIDLSNDKLLATITHEIGNWGIRKTNKEAIKLFLEDLREYS